MSNPDILSRLRDRGLMPWQAEFVRTFVEEVSSPFQVLLAAPGTGKTHASTFIAGELARGGARRILVLSPAAMCAQWTDRLLNEGTGIPVLLINRKVFRELRAESLVAHSPWDTEGIFVLSQDFASQDDIASSLCTIGWDLVIYDDAHRLAAPRRAALVGRLFNAGVVKRSLLLLPTRTPAFDSWLSVFLEDSSLSDSMSMTNWSGPLKNWDGSAVRRPQVLLDLVAYTRGPDEVEFLTQFQTILPALAEAFDGSRLIADNLIRGASSSLFALEQSLQSLRRTLVSPEDQFRTKTAEIGSTQSDLDLASEDPEPPSSQPSSIAMDKPKALALIEQLLSSLESLTNDEKLNALTRLIRSILDTSADHLPRICIFSSYSDSVSYVSTALEDDGLPSSEFTGSTSQLERHEVMDHFNHNGGVLVATDAALQGVELSHAIHVIYYDLPSDRRAPGNPARPF